MHLDEQRGARLREERKRLKLNQDQMAQAAGVRREMWSRYEGGAEPGANALAGAAKVGVDVAFVLHGQRLSGHARSTVDAAVQALSAHGAAGAAAAADLVRLHAQQASNRADNSQLLADLAQHCDDERFALLIEVAKSLRLASIYAGTAAIPSAHGEPLRPQDLALTTQHERVTRIERSQQFNAAVGQVVQGDSHISGGRVVMHESGGPYPVKKAAKRPAEKP